MLDTSHTENNTTNMRTVRLDEGGFELGHLLVRSVALDTVLSHVAVHRDDFVLNRRGHT